jgi:transglutaminase-like putative cysteine protease
VVHGGEVGGPLRQARRRGRRRRAALAAARAALGASLALAALAALAASPPGRCAAAGDAALWRPRSFTVRYEVDVAEIAEGAERIDVWLPVPQTGDDQEVTALRVEAPIPHSFERDEEYGNLVLRLEGREPIPRRIPIVLEATVTRHPRLAAGRRPAPSNASAPAERFLGPDRLVPVSGVIRDRALEVTAGAPTSLEKARAIYDHVTETMRYDKTGEGWGRGDALRACDVRRGNCTDFHALFVGMCRAVGVPATFQIGFSIPEGKEGVIPGYHCWAEFFVAGRGWIPVDCSEASKNRARREFYFGSLDPDRVLFASGRDIRVEGLDADPLNYFIDPVVRVDGRPHAAVTRAVTFVERAS